MPFFIFKVKNSTPKVKKRIVFANLSIPDAPRFLSTFSLF